MALTENISPPGPEVAFGSPLSTFVCCGMEEGGVAPQLHSSSPHPARLVGLEPTGHLPQVGEAMRPRSEVGPRHVAGSDADGGGANGLGRGRTSSDAVCMWALTDSL